ncbi:hypothetical protein HBI69_130790 [Parastagonospora nodorum]|nr:hypothetical protein HBI69_130790 [Parastagonospora nodorum]
MGSQLRTAPPRGDIESARKDTVVLVKRDVGSAIQHAKETIGFPPGFYPHHVSCVIFNTVVGPGLFTNISPVLATAGPLSTMFVVLVLGYLATVVSKGHARMLHVWPIRSSTVTFTKIFVDPWLGLIMGWLYYAMYSGFYILMVGQVATLIDTLGLSRNGCLLAKTITFVLPVLFALMDGRWFNRFQLWLAVLKLCVVVTIISIIGYVWKQLEPLHTRPTSEENVVLSVATIHDRVTAILFSVFTLCPIYLGMDTLSLIAPETIVVNNEPRVSKSPRPLLALTGINPSCEKLPKEGRFTKCAGNARLLIHMVYGLTAIIAGEMYRSVGDQRPHRHGQVDPVLSVFITSSEALSECLGYWMKILFITLGITTEVSVLYVASRSLYWMSGVSSGQVDGDNNINGRRSDPKLYQGERLNKDIDGDNIIPHHVESLVVAAFCFVILLGGHYALYAFNPTKGQLWGSIFMVTMILFAYPVTRLLCHVHTDQKAGIASPDFSSKSRLVRSVSDRRTANDTELWQPPIKAQNLFGILA